MGGAAAQATEITGSRRAFITVSVMLASIMQSLDTTIANVALPRIQGSLSATQDQMAWVLTSYIVAAAIISNGSPGSIHIIDQIRRIGQHKMYTLVRDRL